VVPTVLYASLVLAPPERVQGNVFRLFYLHVPLAWTAYVALLVAGGASVAYLRGRSGAEAVARAATEVGVVATTLVLATGSLWGHLVWGVWWTWDARLTSTLALWLVYVGCLALRSVVLDRARAARLAALLAVAGLVDIPVVQLSVVWWRTLHPTPSLTRPGALAPEFLWTLAIAAVALGLVFGRLFVFRLGSARRAASTTLSRS